MNDDISSKVINIFQKHRRGDHFHFDIEDGGELIISPDGFNYVSLKQDSDGLNNEENLLDVAARKYYIFKIMEMHHETKTVRLNNYYVPGSRLEEFIRSLSTRPGKILEIKQFIPDGMA